MMEIYRQYDSYFDGDVLSCKLNNSDVDAVLKSYEEYLHCEGKIYSRMLSKYPNVHQFIDFTFGEPLDDFGYLTPSIYICTRKSVADKFMKLLKKLEYHNTYHQSYCSVKQEGNKIYVDKCDY